MLLHVLERRFGEIVLDRAIVVMMVVDAVVVFLLMHQRGHVCRMRQVALHGETMQRQAKQQEDVENPAQELSLENAGIIAACLAARLVSGIRQCAWCRNELFVRRHELELNLKSEPVFLDVPGCDRIDAGQRPQLIPQALRITLLRRNTQ